MSISAGRTVARMSVSTEPAAAQLLGEDKHGFQWLQIKGKFDAARFYCKLEKHT